LFESGGRARWVVLVVVVVVLLVVAAAVVGWSRRDDEEAKADPAPSGGASLTTAVPSASPLSSSRAAELSDLLTGGSEADLRKVLVLPSGQPLDPDLTEQLRSLGSISFDLATFTYLDGQSAEVEGTVARPLSTGNSSSRWIFTLLYANSQWLLVNGIPKV
jgi:hypothetical protein